MEEALKIFLLVDITLTYLVIAVFWIGLPIFAMHKMIKYVRRKNESSVS